MKIINMNKIFNLKLYLLLIAVCGTRANLLQESNKSINQEVNKNIEQEKLTKEKSCENKTFFSKNLDKLKASNLGKWAQSNPKKASAITTLLVLEVIGLGLIYSPLSKNYNEDLGRPFYQKVLIAPAYGPFMVLEGMEKLCENPARLRFLIPVIRKMQEPFQAYAKLVTGNE